MKAVQYLRNLISSKTRHHRFLCTNVETEGSEDEAVVEPSQTKASGEPNLIDLDDGDIGQTSLSYVDQTPHQSSSVGTRTDVFNNTSPIDPFPTDSWEAPKAPLRWTRGELIGSGAYGKVYIGLNQETGQLLAVKQVQVPNEASCGQDRIAEHVAALESEVDVLKQLRHRNIVRYLGTEKCRDTLNIFLEYAAGGSVASLLSRFGAFEETLIRVFTRQILEGLEFLHQRKTAHRDIKGGNILVDHEGVVKLADFGASKRIEHLVTLNSGFKSLKGTPYWMAPEVIKQTGHGRQADIWSVGCTVIEMATGKPPWSEVANNVTVMFHIASAKGPPPIPEHFSYEARDFLKLCFNRDPKERPNASRLLLHPFVSSVSQTDRSKGDALWADPLPSIRIDADAQVFAPMPVSEIPSHALNLVSEPSTGMSWRPVPQEKSADAKSPSIETDASSFTTFSREDLRRNFGLKAQWASELEKELKAMKDQSRHSLFSQDTVRHTISPSSSPGRGMFC